VKWVLTAWPLARDVLTTGAGLWMVTGQALSPHPSDVVLYGGLLLLGAGSAPHGLALLSGSPEAPGGQRPSSEPEASGSSPGSPSSSPAPSSEPEP
jgi:hypothetical protein